MFAWMERVPASVLDFWIAFDSVEPIGDEWQQVADIRESLAAIYGAIVLQAGGSVDPANAMDFMPPRFRRPILNEEQEDAAPAFMDPVEEFKMFGRMLGFKEEQLQVKGR